MNSKLTAVKGEVAAQPSTGFQDYAGVGFESASKDDMAMPFLSILQSGSPEAKRSEGAYIDGAQEGMILNTVTRQLIDPGKQKVVVIPCSYNRTFVEWRVRENGGGFVNEHKPDPAILDTTERDEKNREILPNGNQIADTRTFYVLMLDAEGVPSPATITMTSTQIKKAKQWLMQQNLLKLKGPKGVYTPPMFASKWSVSTVPESNEKGSWFGWKFEHEGYLAVGLDDPMEDPVFATALEFHKSVSSGEIKADLSKLNETGERPTGTGGHPDDPGPLGDAPDF